MLMLCRVRLPVDGVFVAFEQTVDSGDRCSWRSVHCGGGGSGSGARRRRITGCAATTARRVRARQRRHRGRSRRVRTVGWRPRQSGWRLQRQAAGDAAMVTSSGRVIDRAGDAVDRRVMARHFTVVLHHNIIKYYTKFHMLFLYRLLCNTWINKINSVALQLDLNDSFLSVLVL